MSWSGHERKCVHLNTGTGRFADVSIVSGIDYFDDGRGGAPVDWDQDGDLDLWVTNRTGPQVRFLRNETESGNAFVAFKLQGDGKSTNRDAIGARVEVVLEGDGGQRLIKTLRAGEGFLSQAGKWVHFGLGKSPRIHSVVVRWPAGGTETFAGVGIHRRYLLEQGTGVAKSWSKDRSVSLKPSPLPEATTSTQSRSVLATRFPLPRTNYVGFDGVEHPFMELVGKPVLINVFASWCGPCRTELSDFAARSMDLRAAGVEVVALSVDGLNGDSSSAEQANKLIDELKFPFASGMAKEEWMNRVIAFYKAQFHRHPPLPIPTSFLLDGAGRLVVLYKGQVSVDQVIADSRLLGLKPEQWFDAALPFPGRKYGVPGLSTFADLTMRYLDEEGAAEASKYLEEFLLTSADLHPMVRGHCHQALCMIAEDLFEHEDIDGAIAHYRRALELQDQSAKACYRLAFLLAEKKQDPEQARKLLHRSIDLDPGFKPARDLLQRLSR